MMNDFLYQIILSFVAGMIVSFIPMKIISFSKWIEKDAEKYREIFKTVNKLSCITSVVIIILQAIFFRGNVIFGMIWSFSLGCFSSYYMYVRYILENIEKEKRNDL